MPVKPSKTNPVKVLIIFYSFSRQTRKLVDKTAEVLKGEGITTVVERLIPDPNIPFPLNSVFKTIKMMIETFFRKRIPIKPLSDKTYENYNMIILAGPTWSYNPSGPILTFLDGYGKTILKDKRVKIIISCRSYWRTNAWYMKKRIKKFGGIFETPIHFEHNVPEPWNTIGVLLTVAGKNINKIPVIRKHYIRYGHNNSQLELMEKKALEIAKSLKEEQ